MTAPVYACARCGVKPRDGDTFLCADCIDAPDRRMEVEVVIERSDPKEWRQALIDTYGWAGWNKRMKGAPRA